MYSQASQSAQGPGTGQQQGGSTPGQEQQQKKDEGNVENADFEVVDDKK